MNIDKVAEAIWLATVPGAAEKGIEFDEMSDSAHKVFRMMAEAAVAAMELTQEKRQGWYPADAPIETRWVSPWQKAGEPMTAPIVNCWEEAGEYPNTSTCMLPDGHAGPHEFTPDYEIMIGFKP